MAREGSEPKEWTEGEAKARQARITVAEQLTTELVERDMTGDKGVLLMRIGQLAAAEREGDREATRAAVMEVSLAAAGWAVSLDLRQR